MRYVVSTTVGLVFFASAAFAQNAPAQQGPANPAVRSTDQNNSSTPVAGANSFTRDEAASRIGAKGYTHITGLQKDANGIWRGTATKDGQTGPISVDYQGNVN